MTEKSKTYFASYIFLGDKKKSSADITAILKVFILCEASTSLGTNTFVYSLY